MIFEKFIEMVKGDLNGSVLNAKYDDVTRSLSFKYDVEANNFNYVYCSIKEMDKDETTGIVSTEEEVRELITDYSLDNVLEAAVKMRIEKETRYKELREQLLSQLEEMSLTATEKDIIVSIINQTTELFEVVGMKNRVYLISTPGYWEHVRIADESNLGDDGEGLHLQFVQAAADSLGKKEHEYLDLTFEEVVKRILESPLVKRRVGDVEVL